MTNYSLENLEQFHGFQIDSYLLALHGWQRGLKLKFHTRRPGDVYFANDTIPNEFPGVVFTLSDGKKSHTFYRTRGDLTTDAAIDLCADKFAFKRHLQSLDINTQDGQMFHIDKKNDMLNFAETIGYPVVLKPATGSMGRGVTASIKDKNELIEAIESLRVNFAEYKYVILETYFEGADYRIYIVGDKMTAAYMRESARVTGDGVSTVQALIDKANELRKRNPNTRNKLITVDQDLLNHLERQNLKLDDIPANNMNVTLRSIPNISLGGNPKDVTSAIPLNIEKAVINAVKSVPGLPNAGVDVLINGGGDYTIIEMNSVAVITSHVFPISGNGIDVPAHIIDYYFPETIGKTNTSMTFNYTQLLDNIASGIYEHIEVKSIPQAFEGSIQLSFSSEVRWINPKSVQAMLQMYDYHGNIANEGNNYVLTVTNEGNINADELIERLKQRFLVRDIDVKPLETTITHMGIHIKKDVPN